MEYIFVGLFGVLFYLFNELEDKSVRNRWTHHQWFLNTGKSWKNKWELSGEGKLLSVEKKWYYFGIYPTYKERFPYSSTILVFLTDGEHLFQFIKKRAIELGFLIVSWKLFVAWSIGTIVMQFIKEKWLKNLQ